MPNTAVTIANERGNLAKNPPKILAGPVVVMRGNEYAGRSRVDFVGPGEIFELGFAGGVLDLGAQGIRERALALDPDPIPRL